MRRKREREEEEEKEETEKARTLELLEPVGLSEVLGGEDGRVEEHEDDHEPVEELRLDKLERLGAAEAVQLSQTLAARSIVIINTQYSRSNNRYTSTRKRAMQRAVSRTHLRLVHQASRISICRPRISASFFGAFSGSRFRSSGSMHSALPSHVDCALWIVQCGPATGTSMSSSSCAREAENLNTGRGATLDDSSGSLVNC